MPTPLDGAGRSLPPRIRDLASSQIGLVADLGRDDPDVVKLWIGEGDLPTPPFIVDAATAAMKAGHTRYTYSVGLPALRRSLSAYHLRHWGVNLPPERFAVTSGGMNAIMQACQAILEPGDEVVIPSPAWGNVREAVRVVGGVPVPVPYRWRPDGGFELPLADIVAAITDRTRIVMINSPANPTGWIMPLADMRGLREFTEARGIWILADEVYNHFVYGGAKAHSFLEICSDQDRLLVCNTMSKNWAMTGWRAGWIAFPQGLSSVFARLGEYNTTSIPTFIQHAASAALDGGDPFIEAMVERCKVSRAILIDGLSRLANVRVSAPEGSFYLLVRIQTGESSLDLAKRLLSEVKLGVAPGTAFGPEGEGFIRICFAISAELAHEAVRRFTVFFGKA